MKAAVISGGGAAGAYTVGVMNRLTPDYSFISGTSTGALMAPLILLRQFGRLKEAYTSVTNKDVYTWEPFDKKGHVKLFNIVWRQLTQKNTLGDTTAMKKLIQQFFTQADYDMIAGLGKEFVANMSETRHYPATIVSVSSKDVSYAEMVNAMWASSNVPVLMSQELKDNYEYADGGLLELFSIKPALERGYKELDVYIHRINKAPEDRGSTKDLLHNVQRTGSLVKDRLEVYCIQESFRMAQDGGCTLNVQWLPEVMQSNYLNFDKEKMKGWYELGFSG